MNFYGDPKKALEAISQGKMIYALIPIDANTKIEMMIEAYGYIEGDLAEECKAEALKTRGGKATEQEDEEEEAEEKKKAATPLDHGKIIALWKAGRSVKWIADEMGCSGQAVRDHIKKEEQKDAGD